MFTRKSENFNSKKENFELYQAIWKENFTQRGRLFFETRKASKITDKILILNGRKCEKNT